MASTTFVPGTVITKEWLNDTNAVTYGTSSTSSATAFWPDVDTTATIRKLQGRVFVYGGTAFTGNRTGTQGGFVPTSTEGANWAPRDSAILAASDKGLIQVCGFVSNANISADPPTESIGVAGLAIANKAGRSAWGLYSDLQFEVGEYGYGIEFAIKNKGTDHTSTPYFPTNGTYGVWLAAGGDASYGGAATAPSNTAIAIGRTNGAPYAWNKGIVFFHDGLTRSSGYSTAIELAEKHRIVWRTALNTTGFDVRSEVSASGAEVGVIANNNAVSITGAAGAVVGQFAHQAGGVNYLQFLNSASTTPGVFAAGAAPDVDISFTPKGTGNVRFGTFTSNADAAVNGYVVIKTLDGVTRKLATIA